MKSILGRKSGAVSKRIKCCVRGHIHGLHDVPFNGTKAFVKWKVQAGFFRNSSRNTNSGMTNPAVIRNNAVEWDHQFEFECVLKYNPDAPSSSKSKLHFSIRQLGSGTQVKRLGYVDIRLASFIDQHDAPAQSLHLLRDSKINAMLKVSITVDTNGAKMPSIGAMMYRGSFASSMEESLSMNDKDHLALIQSLNTSTTTSTTKESQTRSATKGSPMALSTANSTNKSKRQRAIHDVVDGVFDLNE